MKLWIECACALIALGACAYIVFINARLKRRMRTPATLVERSVTLKNC